jgi:hypothetical protein
VKRNGRGLARLWTPAGTEHDLALGGTGVQLDSGLRLSIRDTRRGSGRAGRPARPTATVPPPRPSAPSSAAPPNGQASAMPPGPPAPPPSPPSAPPVQVPPEQAGGWDDPWLT